MGKPNSRTIEVDYLARVEGEGAFHVKVEDDKVVSSQLKIFEPPRFFEGFLAGRSFREAPDITARICGICPVAYQMSSVHAMEKICDFKIEPVVRELRRLLYCGEWIESHALHTFMLHAPDFLGYPDALAMAKDHKEWVEKALQLKKAGNDIVNILGGREIHPINVKVGGFYRYPTKKEFKELRERLDKAKGIAWDAALWMAGLEFPEFEFDYEYVSTHHEDEYAMNEGKLISNKGLDIDIPQYEEFFEEEHMPYSTTLHTILDKKRLFLTGPLSRYNNNWEQLSHDSKKLSQKAGLQKTCINPFKSLLVRMIETFYACEEAIRIIDGYEHPGSVKDHVEPKAGYGSSVTEAPRGILFHGYEIDELGNIVKSRIVAPTSHNQKIIEDDLKRLVEDNLDLDHAKLTHICEQSIRNYDPCISCSTHFLKLDIERS
jgi:coenzyme F420-reducing hydrogenase alpha subunit